MQSAALVFSALLLGFPDMHGQGSQPVTRMIYASVTEKGGRPVVDLTSTDFEVKDGGKTQNITVRLATTPLRVALLVSDLGSGIFQGAALRFCEALLGHGAIAITGITVQAQKVTDYSTSPDDLSQGLSQLGRRSASTQLGAQVVETIYEVAREIRREGTRAAIVVLRAGSEQTGSLRIDVVQNAIRRSGATLYVVSAIRDTAQVVDVDTILNDSARESGGRRLDAIGTTVVPAMEQVAAELINQYEITYTLPEGTRPSDRVSVSTKRKGVTLNAPSRIGS